eukprot:gene12643-16951_t
MRKSPLSLQSVEMTNLGELDSVASINVDIAEDPHSLLIDSHKHSHVYLSNDHQNNEWRTWCVIVICVLSMIIEITCGVAFGSLALIADGIHMSTHAIAFFISASAYSYARVHATDPRYVFGTGKIGELSAYTSAIILVIIALYIFYEGIVRFITPETLKYKEALAVSFIGLSVNILSGLLLTLSCTGDDSNGMEMHHGHSHGHSHGHTAEHYEYEAEGLDAESFSIPTPRGIIILSIFEEKIPPVFRVEFEDWTGPLPTASSIQVKTIRSNGKVEEFKFKSLISFLQSTSNIPEPHEFEAVITLLDTNESYPVNFIEETHVEDDHHDGGHGGHDHAHKHHSKKEDHGKCDHHGHDHGHVKNPLAIQSSEEHETFLIKTADGTLILSIFEDGIPPVFRIKFENWHGPLPVQSSISVTTQRSTGFKQIFKFSSHISYLQSLDSIPEPHEFSATVSFDSARSNTLLSYDVSFVESEDHAHQHGHVKSSESEHNHSHAAENLIKDTSFGHDHDHDHKHHDVESCGHDHDHGHGHGHHDAHGHNDVSHEECDTGHDHSHSPKRKQYQLPDEQIQNNSNNILSKKSLSSKSFKAMSEFLTGTDEKGEKKEKYHRDNNFRAAIIHVLADAIVSVLVIIAIAIAGTVPKAYFLDPLVGIIGSFVIISWGYQLVMDTTSNLLDMNPDSQLTDKLKEILEKDGSIVTDLHVWRLGPGHLGAIVSILPPKEGRTADYYLRRIKGFKALSHVTIEIRPRLL